MQSPAVAQTSRRLLLAVSCLLPLARHAQAQPAPADASNFITGFAKELTGIVNGPTANDQKKAALQPIVERNVDVAKVARFCLGRFWASASPAQQAEYTKTFHQVLLNEVAGHIGEYQGVSITVTGAHPQGDNMLVSTIINRPNTPPANVQWVVENKDGTPLIIDLVAEGTSLRLTQRSDYASYLNHHDNNIATFITALQQQVAAGN
jgi:phospholipid transport system substrate-binding protein